MCFLIYIKPLEYSSINADHNAFILEFKLIFIKKKNFCILAYVNYYVIRVLIDISWCTVTFKFSSWLEICY